MVASRGFGRRFETQWHNLRACQDYHIATVSGKATEEFRAYNRMGERVSDDKPVVLDELLEAEQDLYDKEEPYTTKKLHQCLIITYSPKQHTLEKCCYTCERNKSIGKKYVVIHTAWNIRNISLLMEWAN